MEQSIFVTDRAMVVTTWNHAAERMWGLPTEQMVGRDLFSFSLGDAAAIRRRSIDDVLERGVAIEIPNVPYTVPGGEVRRAVLKLVPLRDTIGEIRGVIGIATPTEAAGNRRR
jgi:PAS domain S-box-containing protein